MINHLHQKTNKQQNFCPTIKYNHLFMCYTKYCAKILSHQLFLYVIPKKLDFLIISFYSAQ